MSAMSKLAKGKKKAVPVAKAKVAPKLKGPLVRLAEKAQKEGRVLDTLSPGVLSRVPIPVVGLPEVEEPAEGVTAGLMAKIKRTRRTKAQMAEARAAIPPVDPFARVQATALATSLVQQSLLDTFAQATPDDWATPPEELPAEYIYLSQNPTLANIDFYRKTAKLAEIKARIAKAEEEFNTLKLDCHMALVMAGVDKVVGAGGIKLAQVAPGFTKKLDGSKLLALGVMPETIEGATVTSPRKGYLMVTV